MVGKRRLLLSITLSLCHMVAAGGHGWNYHTEDPSGPANWGSFFSTCNGDRQSPVDLTGGKRVMSYPPLILQHYDKTPAQSVLSNNGHTAKLSTQPTGTKTIPTMSGGGLKHQYKFSQVHFHWGAEDGKGSEHTVDGRSYPLEMHLVHYKADKPAISDAIEEGAPDSLAVLGVFFQVSDIPNKGMEDLLTSLKEVKTAGTKVNVTPFPLSRFWVGEGDLSRFYRYEGSLTTPSCNEIVQWTVLKTPVSVSQDQLNMLRSLQTTDSYPLVDNFRPVQSLGSRELLEVTTEEDLQQIRSEKQLSSGKSVITGNLVLISVILWVYVKV